MKVCLKLQRAEAEVYITPVDVSAMLYLKIYGYIKLSSSTYVNDFHPSLGSLLDSFWNECSCESLQMNGVCLVIYTKFTPTEYININNQMVQVPLTIRRY